LLETSKQKRLIQGRNNMTSKQEMNRDHVSMGSVNWCFNSHIVFSHAAN